MKILFYVILLLLIINSDFYAQISLPENVPINISENLTKVNVKYINYNNEVKEGYLIVDKKLATEIKEIFNLLLKNKFPINKIMPLENYDWDDTKSMNDNNTSAFNYRFNKNTKGILSLHAYGRAIDINPFDNPLVIKGKNKPHNSIYNINKKGTIHKDSYIVKIFKKFGWRWGGEFKKVKDYQHFEK